MTNLVPVDSFDDVPQIEVDTPLLGGSGGPLNFQAQALANRTNYIKDGLAGDDGTSLIGYLLDAIGAVRVSLKSKLKGYVDVYDFGVVGDRIADDTINMNKALAYGSLKKMVVRGMNAEIKITGPLVGAHAGLVFDQVSLNAGIWPVGSGYTALTWTGRPTHFYVSVNGAGNNVNGILFDNIVAGAVQRVRTTNLAGFHVKRDKCWDISWGDISCELNSRSSTEYMFIDTATTDTSNMSPTGRLQVEQCMNGMAIYHAGNSLCQNWASIHSERAVPVPGIPTWVVGGNRASYMNLRLGAIDDPVNSNIKAYDAMCLIAGNNCTLVNLSTEGGFAVKWDSSNGGQNTLITPQIDGVLSKVAGQFGKINIYGGNTGLESNLTGYSLYGVRSTQGNSFSPKLAINNSLVGITANSFAEWTVEGTMLFIRLTIGLTAKGSSTGGVTITGFPFAMDSSSPEEAFPIVVENVAYAGSVFGIIANGTTFMTLYRQVAGAPAVALTNADIASNSVIRLTFAYPFT